uniref:Uncharacterized protein n=2 Tax=Aegilops tauschii subsp. strangulata TaxID=200361 RepID=A0A453Q6W0_AEGTS
MYVSIYSPPVNITVNLAVHIKWKTQRGRVNTMLIYSCFTLLLPPILYSCFMFDFFFCILLEISLLFFLICVSPLCSLGMNLINSILMSTTCQPYLIWLIQPESRIGQ